MKKIIENKWLALLLTVAWMGLIFYLSHQPASVSSEVSGTFVDVIIAFMTVLPLRIDADLIHVLVRKSAHFFAYFILGWLVFHTVHLYKLRLLQAVSLAFLMTVLYAISDEVHQLFIPGRSGELGDVLIDSAGSLTGIFTYLLVRALVNRLPSKRSRPLKIK